MSSKAIKIFQENLKINDLESDSKISIVQNDSILEMLNTPNKNRFDVIDIDPYGSMIPFLYPSIRAIKDGGLLCLTCTDS